jgi:hypothetical protein
VASVLKVLTSLSPRWCGDRSGSLAGNAPSVLWSVLTHHRGPLAIACRPLGKDTVHQWAIAPILAGPVNGSARHRSFRWIPESDPRPSILGRHWCPEACRGWRYPSLASLFANHLSDFSYGEPYEIPSGSRIDARRECRHHPLSFSGRPLRLLVIRSSLGISGGQGDPSSARWSAPREERPRKPSRSTAPHPGQPLLRASAQFLVLWLNYSAVG